MRRVLDRSTLAASDWLNKWMPNRSQKCTTRMTSGAVDLAGAHLAVFAEKILQVSLLSLVGETIDKKVVSWVVRFFVDVISGIEVKRS